MNQFDSIEPRCAASSGEHAARPTTENHCCELPWVLSERWGAAMSQANLLINMMADRSDPALPQSPLVLIEIPAIKPLQVSRVTRRSS